MGGNVIMNYSNILKESAAKHQPPSVSEVTVTANTVITGDSVITVDYTSLEVVAEVRIKDITLLQDHQYEIHAGSGLTFDSTSSSTRQYYNSSNDGVKQQHTITDIVAANETDYKVKVNDTIVTYTSDEDATVSEIRTGIRDAINAEDLPVSASNSGDNVIITCTTSGDTFTCSIEAGDMSVAITRDEKSATLDEVVLGVKNAIIAEIGEDLFTYTITDDVIVVTANTAGQPLWLSIKDNGVAEELTSVFSLVVPNIEVPSSCTVTIIPNPFTEKYGIRLCNNSVPIPRSLMYWKGEHPATIKIVRGIAISTTLLQAPPYYVHRRASGTFTTKFRHKFINPGTWYSQDGEYHSKAITLHIPNGYNASYELDDQGTYSMYFCDELIGGTYKNFVLGMSAASSLYASTSWHHPIEVMICSPADGYVLPENYIPYISGGGTSKSSYRAYYIPLLLCH